MGFFSFMLANKPWKRIKIGRCDCYTLIPKEFGGGCYHFTHYNGYGAVGRDAYELLAEWNKGLMELPCLPDRLDYPEGEEGDKYYRNAVQRRNWDRQMFQDYFESKDDAYMREHYSRDWKREIGITMYFDLSNRGDKLPFPLKITDVDMPYELCNGYSKDDPLQGCD